VAKHRFTHRPRRVDDALSIHPATVQTLTVDRWSVIHPTSTCPTEGSNKRLDIVSLTDSVGWMTLYPSISHDAGVNGGSVKRDPPQVRLPNRGGTQWLDIVSLTDPVGWMTLYPSTKRRCRGSRWIGEA
jgi:hypothetical protein